MPFAAGSMADPHCNGCDPVLSQGSTHGRKHPPVPRRSGRKPLVYGRVAGDTCNFEAEITLAPCRITRIDGATKRRMKRSHKKTQNWLQIFYNLALTKGFKRLQFSCKRKININKSFSCVLLLLSQIPAFPSGGDFLLCRFFIGQYRIILSADTASEVRQMLSQKRR